MIKKIDHLVITVKNINSTLAFYEKLGFRSRRNGERYELYADDFKINVHLLGRELSPHAQHVQTGSGDFCFETSSPIEEVKEKLEEDQVLIELGIVERQGVNGLMKSIYLRDPDGNLVELSSYD